MNLVAFTNRPLKPNNKMNPSVLITLALALPAAALAQCPPDCSCANRTAKPAVPCVEAHQHAMRVRFHQPRQFHVMPAVPMQPAMQVQQPNNACQALAAPKNCVPMMRVRFHQAYQPDVMPAVPMQPAMRVQQPDNACQAPAAPKNCVPMQHIRVHQPRQFHVMPATRVQQFPL